NPRRLADDVKARAIAFVKKPAVAISLAGIAALAAALAVRKIRNR
ncbi:MAG: hypothetical protein QOK09_3206, partial [Mycobacterium sp.]|nr:hypothetical protein [Mycobacterium sp.]